MFSPWVACAANVYDLNQANPTGLFQRIENDLQDAAIESKPEVEIWSKSEGSTWNHSLTRPLHLFLYPILMPQFHLLQSQDCNIQGLWLWYFSFEPTWEEACSWQIILVTLALLNDHPQLISLVCFPQKWKTILINVYFFFFPNKKIGYLLKKCKSDTTIHFLCVLQRHEKKTSCNKYLQ